MLLSNLFFKKEFPPERDSNGVDVNNEVLRDAKGQADGVSRRFAGTGSSNPITTNPNTPHTDSATPEALDADIVNTNPELDASIGSAAPAPRPDAGGTNNDAESEAKDKANQQAAADEEEKDKKKKLKEQANQYPGGEGWYGALMEMLQHDELDEFARRTIGTVLYMAADFATDKATRGNQDWMGLQGKLDTAVNNLVGSVSGKLAGLVKSGTDGAKMLFGKFKSSATSAAGPVVPRDGANRAADAAGDVARADDAVTPAGDSAPSGPRTR